MTTPNQETNAETVEAVSEDRKNALRKAYGLATAELREQHRDEFNNLYSKHAKELGQDWHPRMTPEQQASAEFDRLLAEFPFLRDRLPMDTSPSPKE